MHMHVHTHTHTCMHTSTHTHTHTHVYTHTHTQTHTYTDMHTGKLPNISISLRLTSQMSKQAMWIKRTVPWFSMQITTCTQNEHILYHNPTDQAKQTEPSSPFTSKKGDSQSHCKAIQAGDMEPHIHLSTGYHCQPQTAPMTHSFFPSTISLIPRGISGLPCTCMVIAASRAIMTKHVFCRDKSMLVATKVLSQQKYFVATNIILSRQKFCHSKHAFVETKDTFHWNKHVCCVKHMCVETNILSQQNRYLWKLLPMMKSSTTHSYQCVQYFQKSIHWYGHQPLGYYFSMRTDDASDCTQGSVEH